jgi:hypothetical protein
MPRAGAPGTVVDETEGACDNPAPAEQTITFDALPDKTFGEPAFAVGATASSGLPITFAAAGKCSIDEATVHLIGAGSCTITASQSGNENYQPAPAVARTFQIAKGPATLTISDLTHTYDGTPKQAVVAVSPAGLTGVAVTYDRASSPPTDAGSYTVEAVLTNDDYAALPVSGTLTIAPATPTIEWTPATPILLGTPLGDDQLNAVVKGVDGTSVEGESIYTPPAGTVLDVGPAHQLAVQFTSTDPNYTAASKSVTIGVHYRFTGFKQPVDNAVLNKAKAGSAIPVKFSLAGNQGLAIFGAGSPSSATIGCGSTVGEDLIEEVVTSSNSGLTYDAAVDQYNYVWKTNATWANTCRKLVVSLTDGTRHEALFHFVK